MSNLKDKITNVLLDMGMPPHFSGFRYTRQAIADIIADGDTVVKTTDLYKRIAVFYNTTPSRVERAIRYAKEYAGAEVSNGHFLYEIAERMQLMEG